MSDIDESLFQGLSYPNYTLLILTFVVLGEYYVTKALTNIFYHFK